MKFEWDDKCQSTFERLKEILVEAPMLIQPTSGRDYTMYSDAFEDRFGMRIDAGRESGSLCFQTVETA